MITFAVNEVVSVDFSVNGREYNGKYYVNLTAWRITVEDVLVSEAPTTAVEDDDDIPF